MPHANALLTPRTRERLARLVVDEGWMLAMTAKMFMVSRSRPAGGRRGGALRAEMADRTSRPRSCPRRISPAVARRTVELRWRHRLGPVRTRPYRPQTNGKIERFHRTLADGWAYARHYTSDTERRAALPGWLHFYHHPRIHYAIGGTPPAGSTTCLDISVSSADCCRTGIRLQPLPTS